MPVLDLTPDELLSTTRAVRRRLDLSRPVERRAARGVRPSGRSGADVDEHPELALRRRHGRGQARRRSPSSTAARGSPITAAARPRTTPPADETSAQAGSRHLAAHLHEVPVHVIPCIEGRPEGLAAADLAWFYGSIIQAGWSFQLAARARGLGGVWTTHHLDYEREAAELLGIPFDAGHAGRADPGRLHPRHRLQARAAQSARDRAALAGVVARRDLAWVTPPGAGRKRHREQATMGRRRQW